MYNHILYGATLQKCRGSQVSKSCYTCNSEAEKGTFSTFLQNKGPGVSLCWVAGTWETQSSKNVQSFTVQSDLIKVLRLAGLKNAVHLQL